MSTPMLRNFGVCTHLGRRNKGWKVEKLLPLMRDMGVSLVRDEALWDSVELQKGVYAIPDHKLDWIDRVNDAGMGVLLLLCYGNPLYGNPLDPQAFARYAGAVAKALRGRRIIGYEIWNEPTNFVFKKHYGGSWSGASPCLWRERFAELLSAAAKAIKEADPGAFVTMNIGESQFRHLAEHHPECLADVDGTTFHPYPTRFPPETIPWGGRQIQQRDGVSVADDDHGFLSLFEQAHEFCRKRLGRDLRIDITEYGFTTYNPWAKPGAMAGYTEEAQAAYLVRGAVLSFVSSAENLFVYDFMDDGTDMSEQEDNFGLIRHEDLGYEPKPAYHAMQRLAQWLGADWQVASSAVPRLDVPMKPMPRNQDEWQQLGEPLERFVRIRGPMAHWFGVGGDLVGIVWQAGRIDGEIRPPVGRLVWPNAPQTDRVEAIDFVTGKAVPLRVARTDSELIVDGLEISGGPVGVRFRGQ